MPRLKVWRRRRPLYDVFISYRRQQAYLADLVRRALVDHGFRVFLDVRELGAGRFDEALARRVGEAPNFVLILAPGSLDRCREEDDWLAAEIAHALRARRIIVPVVTPDFRFPPDAELPETVRPLARYQAAVYDHQFADASIDRLVAMLRKPQRRQRRRLWVAAAAVIVALAAAGTWLWRSPQPGLGQGAPARVESGSAQATLQGNRPGPSAIGVTLYRLRPAAPGDDPELRLLVQEKNAPAGEWIPVRAAAGTAFAEGERVRLAIESGRRGSVYVVDQEQYADGSLGDPYLIFPTSRTRGGQNRVEPGQIVEVPDWNDRPPYFRLQRSRPDHVGEVLTVIVSAAPVADLTIGPEPSRLSRDWLARLERAGAARIERIDMSGGEGAPYSRPERQAAGDRPRLLTHEAPRPQSVYKIETSQASPLVVRVPLRLQR